MPVIVDARSGEVRRAHVFVAVMGGSSLSFACASWTETLPDWIDAHVQAFGYFGGAARLLVPDNPRVAVIKACFYDPQINRTYADMAAHYTVGPLIRRFLKYASWRSSCRPTSRRRSLAGRVPRLWQVSLMEQ